MKKKIEGKKIEEAILNLLKTERRLMNIREITSLLDKKYNLKFSHPIIKRHLYSLKKRGELEEVEGGKVI